MKISTGAGLAAILIAGVFLPDTGWAQYFNAGAAAFPVLELNYDARSIALGGANIALPNEGYGVFSNPASLSWVQEMQGVAGFRSFMGLSTIPLAYVMPEKENGVFGFSVSGLTSGKIDATDIGPDGGPISAGTASAGDYSAALSWARKFADNIGAGISARGIYENEYVEGQSPYTSAGLSLDAGVQGRFLNSRLIYGFALRNLGVAISGYYKNYPLPLELDAGVSYIPHSADNVRLILDISKPWDNYLKFEPALEWELIKKQLTVRAGYDLSWKDLEALKDNLSGNPDSNYVRTTVTGLCLGAGLQTEIAQRKVLFDVAVEFLTVPVTPNIILTLMTDL